jgi:iron complex transport system ATP-binding protein
MSLTADNLTLARGAAPTLSGVSADIARGQITAICGPNGAGKSTLLLGLAGLLEPEQGAVSLGKEPLSRMAARERARRIGYLAQDASIAWDVPVRQVIELGRMPHQDNAREPVDAAIGALDLAALEGRRAQSLSGGETARVLLGRVLAGEPEWILADEPLAPLDLSHQLALLKYLRMAADEGAGVVIVLHDLALAMNFCDRIMVLGKGERDAGYLVADGPPESALDEKLIEEVWGISMRWIGESGARALIHR